MMDKTTSSAARFHAAFLILQAFSLVTFVGVFMLWATFMAINWERFPEWEGRVFPVVEDFVIVHYEEADDGMTNLWVQFKKVRPCQFIRNDAYFSFPDGRRYVEVEYPKNELTKDGQVFSRPTGEHTSGAWKIAVPYELFETKKLKVDSVHVCHPIFKTRTPVLPRIE